MEYRRCGKTNMMVSAVCLGGHWKRIDKVLPNKPGGQGWLGWGSGDAEFDKNRYEVVSRCIDRGINYIDACWANEVIAYSKALRGRRDKMFLGYSWGVTEVRFPEWRTFEKLKQGFQAGLKEGGQEYVDLWRITCHEESSRHSDAEVEELIKALDWAKKAGLARFTGISSHDRPHIKKLIEKYPQQLEVICTPYTAKTKVVTDESGLWAAMKQHDVGWFGIKPFASNSIFKGDSSPKHPQAEEDNQIARLAIRYILCNPAITAPIPGLITVEQVDNMVLAVKERRELDTAERAALDRAMEHAWANLPARYQWLKQWEYV
jgi:aryl-alcohol dehydrogenase-like predicted oxidoreductase